MSMYLTPIPEAVLEKLPTVLSNHLPGAFDIRIQAFPGDDGEPMFSIDVYTNAQQITPTGRQRPYVEAVRTSYFFDADGGFDGEPQTGTTRYP